ncbi:arginyl-tRNA synthetase [Frigoribacterium sp. UYMn621]|uniref:arginyl-tRNA synthetase n=1 Tax=Frigoribacterium sp. UYMn621 TaxID=3156343 RepID=UPI003392584A
MNSIIQTRLRSTILVAALAATVTLGLAGCVPEPKSTPGPTPSTSSVPSASPSVVPSPTPTPSSTASATPTKIPCNTLVSAQVVYDFNPNFGLDNSFAPKAGTAGASAVADQGTACSWLNQTSGDTFAIAVARPAPPALASLKATAAKGTAASGLGDAAYFSTSGGVGRVDVFTGAYWLVATSVYFGSAADANALVTAALGALK